MLSLSKTHYLWCELAVLSVMPTYVLMALPSAAWFIPALWLFASLCLYYLYHHQRALQKIWGWRAVNRQSILAITYRFIPLALLISAVTLVYQPKLILSLYRRNPFLWLMVMVLYPPLSVVPQELIYRAFLFQRYRRLFQQKWWWVIVSALAFALGHAFLRNGLAPLMTFFGGLLFAQTYERTRSLALVSFEHALYGNFIFTLGLGGYFYHGTVMTS